MKRACQVLNLKTGQICGHAVIGGIPVPICGCCAQLFMGYVAPCDFFHFANAGLLRAREARN